MTFAVAQSQNALQFLYVGNDMILELDALKDYESNTYIDDAFITCRIKDADGFDVSGMAFPVTLDYVTGSRGKYRARIDAGLAVSPGVKYTAEIVATRAGLQGQWNMVVIGSLRR